MPRILALVTTVLSCLVLAEEPKTYILTINAVGSGTGKVVLVDGAFAAGAKVALAAVPDEGSIFVKWDNGLGTDAQVTVTMPAADVSVTVTFNTIWNEIKDACQDYLDALASKDAKNKLSVAAMEKDLDGRVQQKIADGQGCIGKDNAMRSIMFDWAADNEKSIEKQERKAILQACFYFVTFLDCGFDMPSKIADRVKKPADAKELIKYLRDEIAKAKVAKK